MNNQVSENTGEEHPSLSHIEEQKFEWLFLMHVKNDHFDPDDMCWDDDFEIEEYD